MASCLCPLNPNKRTIIAIGSNLGNKEENIEKAIELISERVGTVINISDIIETEPEGFQSENLFCNCVLEVATSLEPLNLLTVLKQIEKELGRVYSTSSGYSDRQIDLDIVLMGNENRRDPVLTIPHPRFRERLFVLEPLVQIAPDIIDPVTGMTAQELLERLKHLLND